MNKSQLKISNQKGQAVIELLFLLPVFIAIVFIGYKANTAVQASIVNQKYLRSHMLALQRNHAYYPHSRYQLNMQQKHSNLFVLGMSEDRVTDDEGASQPAYAPKFSLQRPGSSNRRRASESADSPARRSTEVLLRNSVAICTPVISLPGGGQDSGGSALGLRIPHEARQYGSLICSRGDTQ